MVIDKIIFLLYQALFFVTPLIMAPFTSELFEFNKLVFIYLVTIGVVFFWLIKSLVNRKIIIKKTPFNIPILLFLSSQALSTLFSIDRHTSFFGYYGRFNGGLLSLISYILLYFVFVLNFTDNARFKLESLLKTSLLSSLLVIIWGLSGKLGFDFSCLLFVGQLGNNCWTDQFKPAERMFSTLGQPNWLGAYLTVNFFLAVYFFLKHLKEDKRLGTKQIILFGYLVLNFSAILFTRSRSALLAVSLGILLLVCYLWTKFNSAFSKQNLRSLTVLAIFLFTAVLIFKTGIRPIDNIFSFSAKVNKNEPQFNKAEQTSLESGVTASSDIRKIVWKGAIDLGLRYPFLGSGVETFAYSYYFTRPAEHNLTSEWDYLYNKAHNEYLNYFSTSGFVGLLTYLFLQIIILIYAWRKSDLKKNKVTNQEFNSSVFTLTLLIAFLTILTTNFFGFSTTTVNLFYYLIPAFLLISNSDNASSILINFAPVEKYLKPFFVLIFLIGCYLLFGLTRYYLADIKYARGDGYVRQGEYQNAAQYLVQASGLKYEHVYEDKLSNVLANVAFTAAYQKEASLAAKLIKESDELNKKSLIASPQNVLYWKTRAKNYYLFYQITFDAANIESAIKALEKAQELSPTDPKIPYSLAIFYSILSDDKSEVSLSKDNLNKSFAEIKKSIVLKPDYRDGYLLQGQLYKKAGRKNEARSSFEFILKHLDPNDEEAKKELAE